MSKENAIDEIKNIEIKKTCSVGQSFVNNKLIYGVKFNNKNYILTSDKEFERLEECEKKLGIKPKHKDIEISRIASKTITDFVEGNQENYLAPVDLFLMIRLHIKDYIYLEEEQTYDVLALWIMLSYCYTLFTYIPYIHLKGDKGVGKSSLLTILNNTCFNATMWSSMTEAVIFRYIDVSNATLLLDEAEDLKNPKNKSLNGILNAGFNKKGLVPRTDTKNNSNKVQQFNAFSMKAIAGINDIPEVLKDRCINIQMAKKPKSIKLKKYIETSKEITELNNVIVQNLYFFSLSYCNEIYNIYENFKVTMPECLSARDTDIYLPLFCIAHFIDESSQVTKVEENLYQYAEKMSKIRNQQDIEENTSYRLITDLYEIVSENKIPPYKDVYFLNTTLYNYLMLDGQYSFKSTTGLTKALSNLQIEHERINTPQGKNTYYKITLKHLEKLIDSYNITIPKATDEEDVEEIYNS